MQVHKVGLKIFSDHQEIKLTIIVSFIRATRHLVSHSAISLYSLSIQSIRNELFYFSSPSHNTTLNGKLLTLQVLSFSHHKLIFSLAHLSDDFDSQL